MDTETDRHTHTQTEKRDCPTHLYSVSGGIGEIDVLKDDVAGDVAQLESVGRE